MTEHLHHTRAAEYETLGVFRDAIARPFEPYAPELPSAQTVMESGKVGEFGLIFIYKTMDAIDYQTTEEGNILILMKFLKQKAMPV